MINIFILNIKKYKNYIVLVIISLASYFLFEIVGHFEEEFDRIMSVAGYLTWHNLFEFSSILISFSVFVVSYYTYEQTRNLRTIFLGSVFFTIGMIDTFHTLSFKGMPEFFIENTTANRATTFWIIARLIQAIGFVIASTITPKRKSKIKKGYFFVIPLILSLSSLIIVTYHPQLLPLMFIEETGLTDLKIYLEYFIIALFSISTIRLIIEYHKRRESLIIFFVLSHVVSILSEISFVLYTSVYDIYNYLGHVYKFIAFFIIFRVVLISSIKKPYTQLYGAKQELKTYADNLDKIIHKRTAELKELNDKLLNDLKYARDIQKSMFSFKIPEDHNVSFEVRYFAAERVSGDFYSIFKLDHENVAFYIGDVSGHGVAAAMLTVFLNQTVKSLVDINTHSIVKLSPAEILKDTYIEFNKTNFNDDVYIVMMLGIYNQRTRQMTWSSAGHNVEPYLIKSTGEVKSIELKGFPICKFIDYYSGGYEDFTMTLEPNDKIFFYSDGLVEARNEFKEFYEDKRLKNILKENYQKPIGQLADLISDSVFEFLKGLPLNDDITFFIMEVNE